MADLTTSPRVVGTQRPDFHSLESFLSGPQFAGKSGEALVLAIYDYLTSTLDGTYHFWPQTENVGLPRIRNVLYDPVKLLNAYGWLICGQHAALLFALYETAGLETRQFGVPGHNLCEVFYDNRWHVLDVDMWTWFRTPEGHIASPYELSQNARALILENRNKSNPCNLPDRKLSDYADMYAATETVDGRVKDVQPSCKNAGHTMDFQLRPGETLIRSQAHQGRFHFPQFWLDSLKRFTTEWRDMPHERYEPFRTFGNGRWIYEPSLGAPFRDVEVGAWERSGLAQDTAGLRGAGSITFRIQSPYPFCGTPDWKSEPIRYSNGVWLSAAGSGEVTIEITDCEERWKPVLVRSGAFDERLDITALLEARYDCLIRFTLKPGARLSRFRFDGYTMTAPLSLPRLIEGENPLELRCNDRHGLRTVPWNQQLDFRDSADLAAQFVSIEHGVVKPYVNGWRQLCAAPGERMRATARLAAPAGRTLAWLYVNAKLRESLPNSAPQTATLEHSSDGKTWRTLKEIQVSRTHLQWDCSIDAETMIDGARDAYVRVSTPTGISGLEFYGHLHAAAPAVERELLITHIWREDDGEHKFEAPRNATQYSIRCGKNPRLHTIEMRVPPVK